MAYFWPKRTHQAVTSACPVCPRDTVHTLLGTVQAPDGQYGAWFECGGGEYTFCDDSPVEAQPLPKEGCSYVQGGKCPSCGFRHPCPNCGALARKATEHSPTCTHFEEVLA